MSQKPLLIPSSCVSIADDREIPRRISLPCGKDRDGVRTSKGKLPGCISSKQILSAIDMGLDEHVKARGFAQSQELVQRSNPAFDAYLQMFADTDLLEAGAGYDILVGSVGGDQFVFNDTDSGTKQVLNFNSFDTIDLTDFEFSNMAQVNNALTTQATNTVLVLDDLEIVFWDTALEDVAQSLLI